MRTRISPAVILSSILLMSSAANGQVAVALASGNWNDSSIWSNGYVPGTSTYVVIGNDINPISAPIATITLTRDEFAQEVVLGNGAGMHGTIDLAGHKLSIYNQLTFGAAGGGGGATIIHGGGSFSAGSASLDYNSTISLEPNDYIGGLGLHKGSSATTSASTNLGGVGINSGSTLTLGADANLLNSLTISGAGSTLNMNGHDVSAKTIAIGYYDTGAWNLNRGVVPGSFHTETLLFGNGTLQLLPTDTLTNLTLTNATYTTNAANSISGDVSLYEASTLNLGTNLTLSGIFNARSHSIVNMNGFNIAAKDIYLGWNLSIPVTLDRGITPGSLKATNLYVDSDTLDLLPTDSVTNLSLSDAQTTLNNGISLKSLYLEGASTANVSGNITNSVYVGGGSTLNLGADLSLLGSFNSNGAGSNVHMNGHNISASAIKFGWDNFFSGVIDRGSTPGSLKTNDLYISNHTFDIISIDNITNYHLMYSTSQLKSGAAVSTIDARRSNITTTSAENVSGSLYIFDESILTLGADLTLSNKFEIAGANSIVHMNGYDINANNVYLGWNGGGAVTIDRGTMPGSIHANNLYLANDTFSLLSTDSATNLFLKNATTTLVDGISVKSLELNNASTATTTTADSLTESLMVNGASIFNMGADLNLTGNIDARGNGSNIFMNGHNISANEIYLGWYGGATTTVDRGVSAGSLTATSLYLRGPNSLELLPADVVTNLYFAISTKTLAAGVSVSTMQLDGSKVTTTDSNNLTNSAKIYYSSTLDLGADLTLGNSLEIRDSGSTLKMNGHSLDAKTITLDRYAVVDRGATPGSLKAETLSFDLRNFDLLPSDQVTNFNLIQATSTLNNGVVITNLNLSQNSTVTTTSDGNVTKNVTAIRSALKLGDDLTLTGNLDMQSGAALTMNGHDLSATNIYLGWNNLSSVTVNRGVTPGSLKATNLYLASGTSLKMVSSDVITDLTFLYTSASLTTASTNNLSGNVSVYFNSTLHLGADLRFVRQSRRRGKRRECECPWIQYHRGATDCWKRVQRPHQGCGTHLRQRSFAL